MDESASAEAIEAIGVLLSEAEQVSLELARLADQMVAQAEGASRDAQRLITALTEATAMLVEGEAVKASPPPAAGSDGARMLARQMLANGADRAAVERNLRTSFHVEDAAAVVDSIIGAGG